MARNRALLLAGMFVGVLAGIGSYTFVYAKGYSYLTNDPRACANCHVMQDHFDAWTRSSHRAVAVCNDCHTPPGLVPKYLTKARMDSGIRSTSRRAGFPDPLADHAAQSRGHRARLPQVSCEI